MKRLTLVVIALTVFAVYDSRPQSEARSIGNPHIVTPVATSTIQSTSTSTTKTSVHTEISSPQPLIAVAPKNIIQGDPVLIEISNLGTTSISSINFNKSPLPFSTTSGKAEAIIGIDLKMTSGSYPLTIKFRDGKSLVKQIQVGKRVIATAPLGIPDSLGGNTAQSEQTLVSSLVQEAAIMNAVNSTSTKLWNENFRYPLNGEIVVTDVYGYSRQTGATTLSHKGTDFRAATGTPVVSVNKGVVAYTGYLRDYGNVIIIDHGLGVQSVYMHLNEIDVVKGQDVEKGELIAKSGATGYVLGPHLHLSIRINHISIDPMKFLEIMG